MPVPHKMKCKHLVNKDGFKYCNRLHHHLENGYAIRTHCGNCKVKNEPDTRKYLLYLGALFFIYVMISMTYRATDDVIFHDVWRSSVKDILTMKTAGSPPAMLFWRIFYFYISDWQTAMQVVKITSMVIMWLAVFYFYRGVFSHDKSVLMMVLTYSMPIFLVLFTLFCMLAGMMDQYHWFDNRLINFQAAASPYGNLAYALSITSLGLYFRQKRFGIRQAFLMTLSMFIHPTPTVLFLMIYAVLLYQDGLDWYNLTAALFILVPLCYWIVNADSGITQIPRETLSGHIYTIKEIAYHMIRITLMFGITLGVLAWKVLNRVKIPYLAVIFMLALLIYSPENKWSLLRPNYVTLPFMLFTSIGAFGVKQ